MDKPKSDSPEAGVAPRHALAAFATTPEGDHRVPMTPDAVRTFGAQGWNVICQAGMGARAGFPDHEYAASGAELSADPHEMVARAHAGVCVAAPKAELIGSMREGLILAGFLDPFFQPDAIARLAERGVSGLSLELVPRTTIAQSMDALSSQASLAGYAAVILGAARLAKALPMMSTPAGTIKPARVLVVGTGVAGLQAIATAVRLGARVTAYDVRPTAKEQVESLGAKFAKIDLGETGEAAGGYAKELTEAQLEMQRQQLAKLCSESDIIVTTAQVFGRPSPTIVTVEMVRGMKPGAVIVDAAIATGGNVEPAERGREIDYHGVTIIGDPFLASRVARDASMVLASNFLSLLRHCLHADTKLLKDPASDEIVGATLLTHNREIRDARVATLVRKTSAGRDARCS